jgi:predicted ATPase
MIYPVQGLAWPSVESAITVNPEDLKQYDAVHLFVEWARAISHPFRITPESAPAVVEICRRLDGIPLVLELASARVNVLTVDQIAGRLDDRCALLNSGQLRGAVTNHQTLRAAINRSYDLLTSEEQTHEPY